MTPMGGVYYTFQLTLPTGANLTGMMAQAAISATASSGTSVYSQGPESRAECHPLYNDGFGASLVSSGPNTYSIVCRFGSSQVTSGNSYQLAIDIGTFGPNGRVVSYEYRSSSAMTISHEGTSSSLSLSAVASGP